jgi:hypothetical protein
MEFERNVLSTDFGVEQRRKAKFAYYTGATCLVDRLLSFTSRPDADVVAFLCEVGVELQELANSIAVEAMQGARVQPASTEQPSCSTSPSSNGR